MCHGQLHILHSNFAYIRAFRALWPRTCCPLTFGHHCILLEYCRPLSTFSAGADFAQAARTSPYTPPYPHYINAVQYHTSLLGFMSLLQLALRRSSYRLTRTHSTSPRRQPTYQPTLPSPTVSPSDMCHPLEPNPACRLGCWLALAMSAALLQPDACHITNSPYSLPEPTRVIFSHLNAWSCPGCSHTASDPELPLLFFLHGSCNPDRCESLCVGHVLGESNRAFPVSRSACTRSTGTRLVSHMTSLV